MIPASNGVTEMKRKIAAAAAAALALATATMAQSSANMSEAIGDSAEASTRIVAAGGQIVIGAVAVPLALAGGLSEGTGNVAGSLAEGMWDAANAPLTVDEAVVMPQPAPDVPRTPRRTSETERERVTTTTETVTTKTREEK